MKVANAPFTVFADQDRCELSILSDGFRVAMTGEEANALWVEIGTALKQLYADRPEQCPREFAAFLRHQIADTGVDGGNSYAQLSKPTQDEPAPISPPSEAQRPADTAFRRLVRDTFEKKRRSQ